MPQTILCIDMGNTKIAASTLECGADPKADAQSQKQKNKWKNYIRKNLPKIHNAKEHVDQLLGLANEVLAGDVPTKIGVSFGRPVDNNQKNLLSHTVAGWDQINLVKILQQKYKCEVAMDNDANVAALGEYFYGDYKGQDLMYITYSTGIGGSLILNGKIWKSWQGLAGEIGHMLVDRNGPRWWGGRRGAIYTIASGTHIAKRALRWIEDEPMDAHILRQKYLQSGQMDAKLVAEAASQGDPVAWDSLEYSAWGLGTGIANTANILNLPLFVIGGSITKAGDKFWDYINQVAQKSKMPEINFEIKKASLGDEAPLWGCLAL